MICDREERTAGQRVVPPAGFEPALPPPEGGALSPELRGPYVDNPSAPPSSSVEGTLRHHDRCSGASRTALIIARGCPRLGGVPCTCVVDDRRGRTRTAIMGGARTV